MIPLLRFKEFSDDWQTKKLGEIATKRSERNGMSLADTVLTNSAVRGVIPQSDFFEKEIAVQGNLTNYYVVDKDDFIYNPRISVSAPVGPFKRNHFGKGVMSPLYNLYRFNEGEVIDYFEQYLNTERWHEYMRGVANYGARSDRMAVSSANLLSLPFPYPSKIEQQKVAIFLILIDRRINNSEIKFRLLLQYKKSITQRIFTQKIRFQDIGGGSYREWDQKVLSELAAPVMERNKANAVTNVLTNSAVKGVVNQTEFFDKDIANQSNLLNYHIISNNDFVYNPRISIHAPVGPIKRNHLNKGVTSPLYSVFRFKEGDLSFFESYFETKYWHEYLKSISNSGARHDRMNITTADFYNMPVPFPSIEEQQRISNFLINLNERLKYEQRQLAEIKRWRKELLKRMFV